MPWSESRRFPAEIVIIDDAGHAANAPSLTPVYLP